MPTRVLIIAVIVSGASGDVGFMPAAALDVPGGPFQSLLSADVDRDGWPDLLAAEGGGVWWLGHPGGLESAFEPIEALTGLGWVDQVVAADLDGDGDLDVLGAGLLGTAWAENLGLGASWASHPLGDAPGPVAVADLDRGGRLDVVLPTQDGQGLRWLRGEDGLTEAGTIPIGASARAVVGADVSGDGAMDLVSISAAGLAVHLNDGGSTPGFGDEVIGAGDGTAVVAGDLDGDGDEDLAVVGALSVTAVWNLGAGGWQEESIDSPGRTASRLEAIDLERDGDIDLVIHGTDGLVWYEREGAGWTRREPSAGDAVASAIVDLDRDGDLDAVVAHGAGGASWLANAAIHRTATFPDREAITIESDGAYAVASGDLDGDGDPDLASVAFNGNTVSWHENADGSFVTHEIGASNGPTAVLIVDVDGDGRPDVVSGGSRDDTIRLHRNMGGHPPSFSQEVVSMAADGVFGLAWADIDGDGDLDLASACKNDGRVRWHENSAGDGSAWIDRVVLSGVASPFGVAAGDIDGDGDIDLVSACRDDDHVRWHENDGASPPAFVARTITAAADGAVGVAMADLDRDGDVDVLSVSRNDNTIRWFESDGAAPPMFTPRTISSAALGATWVGVFDAESDGDLDVLAALRDSHTIAWYQNDGASLPTFSPKVVTAVAQFASGGACADFDRDGRMDVAVASVSDDTIAWHPNRGGQVAATAASTAPATMPVLRTDDLLRIDVVNRARAGELSVRPWRVTVRLEDETGVALLDAQALAIVERLTLALDGDLAGGGSGGFDPLGDLVLAEAPPTGLVDGELTFDLSGGPSPLIVPGGTRRLFIAATMTSDAGLQALRRFRVIVRSAGAPVARDATFEIATITENAADTATVLIEARCSADLTGSGDPQSPDYGVPDGLVDASDFFYYLDRFAVGGTQADMTGSGDPNSPAYGNPDGAVDASDFFYYLDRFVAGC